MNLFRVDPFPFSPAFTPPILPVSEHSTSSPHPECGICLEQFQVAHSPISASLAANSSTSLPFGLRLPCPGQHTYCILCLTEYIRRKLDPGGAKDGNTHTTVFPIPCPDCLIMGWEYEIQDDVAEKVFDVASMSVWVIDFPMVLRSK